ncbi:MAG: FHA domain-containing protein [Planctomycetes bacterium]|nr:FHA domain-containing protein [Planctomycetota bacterium]
MDLLLGPRAPRRQPPVQKKKKRKVPPFHALLGPDQEQQGPFGIPELRELRTKGDFTEETLVWHKGMPDWVPAGTVPPLKHLVFAEVPPPPPRSTPPPPPPKAESPPPPPKRQPPKKRPEPVALPPTDTSEAPTERFGGGIKGADKAAMTTQRLDPAAAAKMRQSMAAIPSATKRADRAPTRRLRPEDIKAFLCCEPFRALPLTEGRPITIGRSRTSDLTLPHESVSRTHALVRVLGDRITVEDKSTYGLHLNGERIQQGPVQVGDVIQLGPYLISVRKVPDRTAEQMGEEVTRPLRTLGATSEAMSGRLERVSLAEVLQQIEFNKKTGTLRVFDDKNVASTLVVYEGAPVYAEGREGSDDNEVVHDMLRLKRGQFSFHAKVEAGEMTMQDTTLTRILLDFSRLEDEAD